MKFIVILAAAALASYWLLRVRDAWREGQAVLRESAIERGNRSAESDA